MNGRNGSTNTNPPSPWSSGPNWRGVRRNSDRESVTENEYAYSSPSRERGYSDRDTPAHDSADGSPEPSILVPYWSVKRHLGCGNPNPPPPWIPRMTPWRPAPGKLKAANAALVLCLNIDVDPPDVVKTNPSAVTECWIDPHTMPSHKALEAIGSNLQHQFEGLSQKIPYKPILDPTQEDFRRFCIGMRKQAKEDTVLLYYNGHGVPRPTPGGELWVFNRNYTQYIPVSLQDIQGWVQSPAVHIWDCSAAGHLMNNFLAFAEKRDAEARVRPVQTDGLQPFMNSILMAACLTNEDLPSFPELPADLFTSCLTSPIDIALRWFVMNHHLPNNLSTDKVMQIPGDLKDRRTPLGELHWIFTAITDTIAWTTFSHEVFTRLYRSDILIASLFRNFLLAERIMKNYHCTPHTHPRLPPTNTHPLWASWDLAVDACLRQMPTMMRDADPADIQPTPSAMRARRTGTNGAGPSQPSYTYQSSRFFMDQLTAFEVWISRGGSALTRRGAHSLPPQQPADPAPSDSGSDAASASTAAWWSERVPQKDSSLVPRRPPEQLPIVLQVLLSQPHRLRALILLSQFVDLGPWAVHLVLQIGIFPYISKLLQAAGQELRPVLIFIWARILAVDPSCQVDLYTNRGYEYFARVLANQEIPTSVVVPNRSEHKAMCAFILSAIARNFTHGQNAVAREHVFDQCLGLLEDPDFLVRQWAALCVAMMWGGNDEIRVYGVDTGTQDKLIGMLTDDAPEVRAAVLYALSTFMGASGAVDPNKTGGGGTGTMPQLDERIHFRMEVAVVTGAALAVNLDASPMVKKELLVLISCLVKEWRGYFVICAWIYWEEARRRDDVPHSRDEEEVVTQAVAEWLDGYGDDEAFRDQNRVILSSIFTVYCGLLELSVDSYPEVAAHGQTIVDYITALLSDSPFARLPGSNIPSPRPAHADGRAGRSGAPRTRTTSATSDTMVPPSPASARPPISRADTMTGSISSGVSNTLKRTSSFANALKTLAGGIAFPVSEDGRASPAPSLTTSASRVARPRAEAPVPPRAPSPNLNLARYAPPYSRPSTPTHGYGTRSSSPAPGTPLSELTPPTMDFLPSDVMEALMEEDMERLRARRRAGSHAHNQQPHNGGLLSPSQSTFSVDSSGALINGLGTGVGVKDVLPLKSKFYDWCVEYFKEPQMRQAEPDDPGSIQYNYQVWRIERNERALSQVHSQAKRAVKRPWNKPVKTLQTTGCPLSMAFHAHDPHLIVANESDLISVWDWSKKRKINQFNNGNPARYGVTALHIINQWQGGMILAGSADGVVRLYRNYDPALEQGPVQLVSSFQALGEVVKVKRGSGLVLDWRQMGGNLLAGGDSRVIRLWDAHTESQLVDLDTNSESPVTSIMSDHGSSSTFIASFADGGVKVFDRRLEEDDAIVRSYRGHTSWVQNVRWHPFLGGQFFSASLDGEVKLWDLRGHDGAVDLWEMRPEGLEVFDVHVQTGVFGMSSAIDSNRWRNQHIRVHSPKRPEPLAAFKLATGLMAPPSRAWPSAFIPRSSSFVFHPTEMLYGIGEPNGSVRVLGCDLAAKPEPGLEDSDSDEKSSEGDWKV